MHHFALNLVTVVLAITITLTVLTPIAVADLKSDLREFQALVPRRRIGYIAASHYLVDGQFRAAVQYVRSADFVANWQRIRNTSEFGDIVAYATQSGAYDVTRLVDRLSQQLRSYAIPTTVPASQMLERNLATFLDDAVQALPRGRIADLMARKVREGGDFADFYETVRSREFKQLVQKARKSPSLAAPLKKLSQHYIDVDKVIALSFSLLEWGPQPAHQINT